MKHLFLLCSALAITSCGGQTGQQTADSTGNASDTALAITSSGNTPLQLEPISSYFLKNTIRVKDSLTYWVINNQHTYDSLFAPAKTMTNEIVTPDFGTQLVIAAAMPATEYGTEIQLQNATFNDSTDNAEVYFIASGKAKQSYKITPVWIGTLPKTGLKTIKFYTGDDLSQTINIDEPGNAKR